MRRARKTQEVTARQLLNWIAKTLPRIEYHSGDKSVSIYAGRGYAHAKCDAPAGVLEAMKIARLRDIKERAQIRRDKREGFWPYNVDQHKRIISGQDA